MTCSSFMTPNPVTVAETDSIGHATQLLTTTHYINLPVVDSRGDLVGLFGVYDLFAMLVPRIAVVGDLIPNLRFVSDDVGQLRDKYLEIRGEPVQRAMNREPVTVTADTPIIEALRLFCRNHMTIPVLAPDSRRLLGIISHWDAARAIMGADQ